MFRRKETKRAHAQAVSIGKRKTHFKPSLRYAPRGGGKPAVVSGMTDEEKHWFPDVWESMVSKCGPIVEVKDEGPSRRMDTEVEASVCRAMRIYKRCSRNCTPRAFGGCKGHLHWASCPQLEQREE